jgi:ubiquinone/menaquinone biosynthesis C-methylase UbiE
MTTILDHCTAGPATARGAVPDYAAVKQRQQAMWASGDFALIGTTLQIVGEALAEAMDVCAGERILDVAAGNGNATLAAARRFARVVSTDYVEALLDKGAARARAEGQEIEFRLADAESLPFADGEFDAVMSTFGVMFAPDQRSAASELARVVRSGGRVGLANWTPEGFIGEVFRTVGRYVPPPGGVASPALWGTEPHIVELLGRYAKDLRCERRIFNMRYRSSEHWLDVFRRFYGPTHKAFLALDAAGQAGLARDLTALLERYNVAGQRALVIPAEYLEVVVVKQ